MSFSYLLDYLEEDSLNTGLKPRSLAAQNLDGFTAQPRPSLTITPGSNGYLFAPDGPTGTPISRATAIAGSRPVSVPPAVGNAFNSPAGKFLTGRDPATHRLIKKEICDQLATVGVGKKAAARIAGSGIVKAGSRLVPGLSVAGNIMDVADIVTNDTSFGNKAMDAAGMAIGGTLGLVVGAGNPLAASFGASVGKMGSDGLQWLFGDKKTAKQRKMEEALSALGYRV